MDFMDCHKSGLDPRWILWVDLSLGHRTIGYFNYPDMAIESAKNHKILGRDLTTFKNERRDVDLQIGSNWAKNLKKT